MKYFIDTEFHEYHKQVKCCGIKIGKPIPTIDLISIGIVAEDGREYYAISKDFNTKDAWNSFQRAEQTMFEKQNDFKSRKVYWLRDNVLRPIFYQLVGKDIHFHSYDGWFVYDEFKKLILKYAKTNKQIAQEIKDFIAEKDKTSITVKKTECDYNYKDVEFYGYYSDYDWVVFAQLFGKMINLPDGFPMYCIDLKQTYDEKNKEYVIKMTKLLKEQKGTHYINQSYKLKDTTDYPKQTNEHNALADAKWNYELYKFLNTL